MKQKLTNKQKVFCEEYVVDSNAKQSAIRAGYSEKTAQEQGSRLLSYAKVREYINVLKKKRSKKTEITAEYVLNGIKRLAEQCEKVGVESYSPANALKAYELLGKHLVLFTDKVQNNHTFTQMGSVKIGESEKTITFNVGKEPDRQEE